jgi:hypothetical protein
MKAYLAIDAIEVPYFGGVSPTIKAVVFREPPTGYYTLVVRIDFEDIAASRKTWANVEWGVFRLTKKDFYPEVMRHRKWYDALADALNYTHIVAEKPKEKKAK